MLFVQIFRNWNFAVFLLNGARFLQLALENSRAKAHLEYKMEIETRFRAQSLISVGATMPREIEMKNLMWFDAP